MSYEDTEALYTIMDEVRRQTGLNFDADMWSDDSKWDIIPDTYSLTPSVW